MRERARRETQIRKRALGIRVRLGEGLEARASEAEASLQLDRSAA